MAAQLIAHLNNPLDEGFLRKTHEAYGIYTLAAEQLPLVTALQAEVLNTLGADSYFLVPKTRAQMFAYLNSWPLSCMYGLTVNSQYAGQIILRTQIRPHEHARNIAAIHDLHSYGLIQGAITHPDLRGRGLLSLMLDFITHTVFPSLPIDLLLARVVPENVPSWNVFIKCGYSIVAAEPDPDDERRVFYMGYGFQPKMGETRLIDAADYDACQILCRNGWHGVGYDSKSGLITFQR